MHTAVSTAVSFVILFGVVGYSFVYVSGNPVTVDIEEEPEPLGIFGVNVTPAVAQANNLSEARGVMITSVTSGSTADRAGMRGATEVAEVDGQRIPVGGDVIIAIDGRSIDDDVDARTILDQKRVGDNVRFTVIRGSNTLDINVTVEPRQS
ncbi:MAG TPA: PDZ domain-containing protein [Nitrososphaera sp.]